MIKLNKFTKNLESLSFGNYILFQEIIQSDESNKICIVSNPILAIYLGWFPADQTVGFNYIKWNNDKRLIRTVDNNYEIKEVDSIYCHIEWTNYIHMLGIWNNKPNYKEILLAYRTKINNPILLQSEIEF
jgi:hypothetical protein